MRGHYTWFSTTPLSLIGFYSTALILLFVWGSIPLPSQAQRQVNDPNLHCYECGVIFRTEAGSVKDTPCDNSSGPARIKHNCAACIRTFTRVVYDYRKPRWGSDQRQLEEESRMCLADHEPMHPIGDCVRTWGSDTYIVRCYCKTNLCNAALPSGRFHGPSRAGHDKLLAMITLPLLLFTSTGFMGYLL